MTEPDHYLSTACYHEDHVQCRKTCKFCSQECSCQCRDTTALFRAVGFDDLKEYLPVGWLDWDGNFHPWTGEDAA